MLIMLLVDEIWKMNYYNINLIIIVLECLKKVYILMDKFVWLFFSLVCRSIDRIDFVRSRVEKI